MTDPVSKVLLKHSEDPIVKPSSRIIHLLTYPIDSLNPLSSQGLNSISCSCGVVYIGETVRAVKTHLVKHERSMRSGHLPKIRGHTETGNHILFDIASVVLKSCFLGKNTFAYYLILLITFKFSIVSENVFVRLNADHK